MSFCSGQKSKKTTSVAKSAKNGHFKTIEKDVSNRKLSDVISYLHNATENHISDRIVKHMQLHTTLKMLMKKNGHSARMAAKSCGIPASTFLTYLKPIKHRIDPSHILAISKFYKVSIDYLFFGEQGQLKIDGLPTKKVFTGWVKISIEQLSDNTNGEKE